ncbi:MAG: hypothetical protein Harvfovirus10_13 [Harvfovirus sp.]|uniref:MYM-type domain-containing protein n=1 Tax=Harvfovirus sp. TaxID=2487768 RepID=A0A3G5A132_9VIRU|nr:MAG: hypothetical protein Harvfovirus10_13 [Harvfovirus sp.]
MDIGGKKKIINSTIVERIAEEGENLKSDGINEPRKRGRPRKNKIVEKPFKLVEKKRPVKENDTREIILHIPLCKGKSSASSAEDEFPDLTEENEEDLKEDSEKNAFASETNDTVGEDAILTISDQDSDPSDEAVQHVGELENENKKLHRLIKQLKSDNLALKNTLAESAFSASREVSIIPMNVSFIDTRSGKAKICDKTDICCWWDTCSFETLPVYIPERFYNGHFYVFGCFCSFDCAAAYNLKLNDYKVSDRYSLIKKLHFLIMGKNIDVPIAPPREVLDKFGGHMTIGEYRAVARMLNKEYKLLLPPMINQLACIEEKTKECDRNSHSSHKSIPQNFQQYRGSNMGNNMLPVKKKSLYSSNNLNIMDTIGIKEK